MRRLTMAWETLVSDRRQRSIDAMFDAQFPENGSFVRRAAGGRDCFYHVGYVKAVDGGAAGRRGGFQEREGLQNRVPVPAPR